MRPQPRELPVPAAGTAAVTWRLVHMGAPYPKRRDGPIRHTGTSWVLR